MTGGAGTGTGGEALCTLKLSPASSLGGCAATAAVRALPCGISALAVAGAACGKRRAMISLIST